MKIGKITINSKLALAPMAGVTDLGFRTVCRELGAGYTVTEMVSAKALCYQDKKSLPLLELGGGEHPAAVQLFGSDPYCMEQAAGIAAEKSGADILDINMGCPVPKVTGTGAGSAWCEPTGGGQRSTESPTAKCGGGKTRNERKSLRIRCLSSMRLRSS